VLSKESVFLAYSLCFHCAQKRNQCIPLKITCIIELNLILLKLIPFRLRQIVQQTAATPTQINCLILICWLESQELNIWPIDLGGVNPVAIKIIKNSMWYCMRRSMILMRCSNVPRRTNWWEIHVDALTNRSIGCCLASWWGSFQEASGGHGLVLMLEIHTVVCSTRYARRTPGRSLRTDSFVRRSTANDR